MEYYGAKELAASFRTVRKNTLTIAEEIGEEHYGFSAAEGARTIGQTLAHIALTPKMAERMHGPDRLMTLAGFDFPTFMAQRIADEQKPRTKQEIVTILREDGERLATWLEGISEEILAEHVTFPEGMVPPSKSRFEMLLGLKEHEMHHRAQLMVMQRMLGMVPHLTRDMNARIAAMQAASKASA